MGYGLGTPYHYGSITNHVRSFQMLVVDKNKKVKRIQVEPSKENAIHDPYKWCRMYPDIQLIQDDSCFHALLVSLGSCGVMYSVYIELMNAHYLYEQRYIMSWKQFKRKKWAQIDKKCKNGDIVRMQFHISPYLTYKGKPHLGLYFHMLDQNIWKNHGVLLKEWIQWYSEFNAVGTFCNAFAKETELDKIAADCGRTATE